MNKKLKNKKVMWCDLDGDFIETLIETICGETFPWGLWI